MSTLEFPTTYRSAFLFYRLLQLRFASREQIQRHIFGDKKPKSQKVVTSKHLSPMLKHGYIKNQFGLFYVSQKGWQILSYLLDNPPKRKNGFADAFYQIDRDSIELPPNPKNTNKPQMEHHRQTAEILIHFFEKKNAMLRTDSKIELYPSAKDVPDIRPDQTIINDDALGFIEFENLGELKRMKDKMKLYIRYYFSGDFHKQFPEKKYARVFVVHNNQRKTGELIKFLLRLTYKDLKFKEPVHSTNDHIGRNLFRFSGLDFNWIKAGDWSKQRHNG
jgi:hypothetical protein